ncbi:phage tail tape measure protein [Methylobacterium sp. J-070]|uniref:phage tail tape measure protein n=1 Tax=Methylobacterium sp. J-070 TaxID=2836650 RepID=UPI001FBA1CCD|nr:phage tail tape measure protein [Methylobacterium sp. J-070]MCJ2054269.1 phage tail tape measure protein [Methylobacterium sp. J-070]
MSHLDVALRLRLQNELKAGAREARRDIAGIGEAARGLGKEFGKARGFDQLGRDIEGAGLRARRLDRQLAGLGRARGASGLGPALEAASGHAAELARATARIAGNLDRATGRAAALRAELAGVADAAERAQRASGRVGRMGGRMGMGMGMGVGGRGAGGPVLPPRGGRAGEDGAGAAGALAARFGAGALGIGGGAYAVGALGKKAVSTYADLQSAAKALAITADATDATVAATVERFRTIGPSLGATPQEMIEAAKVFVEAGLDYKTAVDAVVPSLKTARASFGELPETAKAGVAAISNLGITVDALPEAFDRMAKAGKEGNVELRNLARILPAVAAGGSNLGLKGLPGLTDIVGALEIIGKVTASPDEAANRLENLFAKGTADETVRSFEKVGAAMGRTVDLEKEMEAGAAKGESKLAVLLRLTRELTQGNPFRINELFGDMQARQAIEALLKFEAEYDGIRARINAGSKGLVEQDFARATDRLKADFERLGAAWDRLAGRVGEGLAPGVAAATREATTFLERLEQGDTILQRMATRFGPTAGEAAQGNKALGDRAEGVDAWFEENLPWLSGKRWNAAIDARLGTTGQEAGRLRDDAAARRRAAEEAEILARPDAIRGQIGRRQAVLDRSRARAAGEPGLQRNLAERQVQTSEAEIGRLEGELAKATAAVEALKAQRLAEAATIEALARQLQSLDRLSGFGLGGPKGEAGAVGSGRAAFGLGPGGTKAEIKAEPQDLSGTARQTMDTYERAVTAALEQIEAVVKASAARMQSALSFTAAPTIAPTISAPSGGGRGAAPAAAPGGGGAPARGAALRRGGTTITGPIHVHGVTDVASLHRGIQREADRKVREARNDALHDTGNDFA